MQCTRVLRAVVRWGRAAATQPLEATQRPDERDRRAGRPSAGLPHVVPLHLRVGSPASRVRRPRDTLLPQGRTLRALGEVLQVETARA